MLKPSQLRYLTEVLGLDSVLRPIAAADEASAGSVGGVDAGGPSEAEVDATLAKAAQALGVYSLSEDAVDSGSHAKLFHVGSPNSPFVFFVPSTSNHFESSPEHELLQKVIVATKLKPDIYSIAEVESVSDLDRLTSAHGNQAAIYFGGVQPGSIKKYGECAVLFTHSLAQLLADQGLKKSTWNGLQELLKGSLK